MFKYWLYLLGDLDESFLKNCRFYRAMRGGIWYKQTMSGELPGCYGSWWTKNPLTPNRYHYTEKTEDYNAS